MIDACVYPICCTTLHCSNTPRFDGDEQQNLGDCGVCVDPEYNVLWSYSPHSGKVACFNPIAADIDGESGHIREVILSDVENSTCSLI